MGAGEVASASAAEGTEAATPTPTAAPHDARARRGHRSRARRHLVGDQGLVPSAVRARRPHVISGVVLAAGEGRRFGGTKQLAMVDGKALAQHAIDALAAADVGEIVVVTGHDADAVEDALRLPAIGRFVRNPAYRDGQSASLAAALHAIADDSEAAVVLMADQPGVSTEAIDALIGGFRRTRQPIVRLIYDGGPGPALLSREIYAEAGHLHGDTGARVMMASHPEWIARGTGHGPGPARRRRARRPRHRAARQELTLCWARDPAPVPRSARGDARADPGRRQRRAEAHDRRDRSVRDARGARHRSARRAHPSGLLLRHARPRSGRRRRRGASAADPGRQRRHDREAPARGPRCAARGPPRRPHLRRRGRRDAGRVRLLGVDEGARDEREGPRGGEGRQPPPQAPHEDAARALRDARTGWDRRSRTWSRWARSRCSS